MHGKTYYKIIISFDTILYVEISMDLLVIWYQVISDFDSGLCFIEISTYLVVKCYLL